MTDDEERAQEIADERDIEAEGFCPKTKDEHVGGHCNCWWDGGPCCWCGNPALPEAERVAQGMTP